MTKEHIKSITQYAETTLSDIANNFHKTFAQQTKACFNPLSPKDGAITSPLIYFDVNFSFTCQNFFSLVGLSS